MTFQFILTLSLIFISSSYAATPNEADILLGSDRKKIFFSFVEEIKKTQIVSSLGLKRLNTTWDEELNKVQSLFMRAQTKYDVYYALLALQRSFHDGHSYLIAEDLVPPKSVVAVPIQFKSLFDGKNWVYVVTESLIPEVPKGGILTAIENKSVLDLENEYITWNRNSSRDSLRGSFAEWITSRNSRNTPTPKVGDKINLKLILPKNKNIQSIELTWQNHASLVWPQREVTSCGKPLPNDNDYKDLKLDFVGINYCVYASPLKHIKIVRYFSFYYFFENPADLWNRISKVSYKIRSLNPNQTDDYGIAKYDQKMLIQWLQIKQPQKVYLDLRENDGGGLFYDLPSAFASKPFRTTTLKLWLGPTIKNNPDLLSKMRTPSHAQLEIYKNSLKENSENDFSKEVPFFCVTPQCDLSESMIKPTSELKKIPLIIISGPKCFSSCDQTVAIFKTNGIGQLAGMPPAAGSSPSRIRTRFKLANEIVFEMELTPVLTMLPNGEPLEGNTLTVDYPFLLSLENEKNYLIKLIKSTAFKF
jgi:hypothetical protein